LQYQRCTVFRTETFIFYIIQRIKEKITVVDILASTRLRLVHESSDIEEGDSSDKEERI